MYVVFNLQLSVRHRVDTDPIMQLNRKMTPFQQEQLERTAFRWLLDLQKPIQNSLREYVS